MAQHLTLAALAEDLSVNASNHIRQLTNTCISNLKGSDTLLNTHAPMKHMEAHVSTHTHTYHTHIYIHTYIHTYI